MSKFKIGDRVRYTGKHPRYPKAWAPFIGLEGVVTEVRKSTASFEVTKTNATSSFKLGDTYNRAFHDNLELILDTKFKVGDKVRFTYKCPEYWWFGPSKKYKTGVVAEIRDAGHKYTVNVEGKGPAYVNDEHIALDALAPAGLKPKARFIVAVEQGGKLAPNTAPKEYKSQRQAESVAKKMAEKHGQTFYVLQAVSAAVPPSAPKAEIIALD